MNLKKLLISGLLLAALSQGCTGACNLAVKAIIPSRPIVHTQSLEINTENEYRAVVKKSESEGISDMRKLLRSSNYEESWMFLPDTQEWYETGIFEGHNLKEFERGGSFYSRVASDVLNLEDVIMQNNEFTLYHIHPASEEWFKVSKRRLDRKIEEIKRVLNELEKEGTPKIKHRASQMKERLRHIGRDSMIYKLEQSAEPSIADLANMVFLTLSIKDINPDAKVRFKVCSALGVYEYSLTEEGYKRFTEIPYLSLESEIERLLSSQQIRIQPVHINRGSPQRESDIYDVPTSRSRNALPGINLDKAEAYAHRSMIQIKNNPVPIIYFKFTPHPDLDLKRLVEGYTDRF